jgi:hypothetical protein
MANKTAPQPTTEISSWNEKIFAFGFDDVPFEESMLNARIDRMLAGFGEPMNPVDPCGQFSCSSYWPLQ